MRFNPMGIYAHKKVNRYAVFTLPEELVGFYKKHIDHLLSMQLMPINGGMQ